ncbi:hypothetical protein [Sorangium sp. So ce388]|uniref:hypothetical protein n=1 Tax=Sorangium sp. So ce388 TaxID=3133309 RepID=UPI003F5C8D52
MRDDLRRHAGLGHTYRVLGGHVAVVWTGKDPEQAFRRDVMALGPTCPRQLEAA